MSIITGLSSIPNKLFEKYTLLPLSQENFLIAASITLNRRRIAWSSNPHPSSDPYLSGDSFASIADHVLNDGQLSFRPEAVKRGDVVFINSHLIHYFFRNLHPRISTPYVLVTHNGDLHIDKPHTRYIDQKILHWFAQNVVTQHPKLTPIPIGLENLFYFNHGATYLFDDLKKKRFVKQPKLLLDFSRHTNAVIREPIFQKFKNHPLVHVLQGRLSAPRYLEQLAHHQFVLSPPGNGLDCHRTWEAMYVGTVPIVEKSVTMDSFEKLGLPMLVVNDWHQVMKLTGPKLTRLYEEIQNNCDRSALNFEYWQEKIVSQKNAS